MNVPAAGSNKIATPIFSVGAGFDWSDPNSPLARYYLRTVHLVAVGFVGIVFALTSLFPLWHTDVWGHVKYGQWMVENGRLPDRELFCPWWDGRQEFTQFYTVTQVVMYLAYAAGAELAGGDEASRLAGGIEMLRTLHAVLTAARFVVLLVAFLRLTRSWPVSLLGLFAVAILDLSNLAVFRPQSFAQLFFAIMLVPLSRETLSRRAVVLLPLLCVLWVNSHGSYLVAFAVIGCLLTGRIVEGLASSPRKLPWKDRHTQRLAATLILSIAAAALLNPYGFDFFRRTMELTRHPTLMMGVGEWKPLTFEWDKGWHWVFMFSLAVIGGTQLASRRPIPPGHVLLLLAFGVGAALQLRFVIWWAMVVPWVMVPRWHELASWWPARLTPNQGTPSLRKTAVAILLGWATLMWSGIAGWAVSGKPTTLEMSASTGTPWQLARQVRNPDDQDSRTIVELDEILRTHYPNGRFTGTVMATPMQGDYLMWALAPDVPVTYSHIHLFHPDYWEELGLVGQGKPGWWDVLDKYRVNLLVVEADYADDLRTELKKSPGWRIVLDEAGDARKPNPMTRQLVAVRLNPR